MHIKIIINHINLFLYKITITTIVLKNIYLPDKKKKKMYIYIIIYIIKKTYLSKR